MDCGWTLSDRAENGTLTWNPSRFPGCLFQLGDFIHGLGLKFGVYSDCRIQMCVTGEPAQAGGLGTDPQSRIRSFSIDTAQATKEKMPEICILGDRFAQM